MIIGPFALGPAGPGGGQAGRLPGRGSRRQRWPAEGIIRPCDPAVVAAKIKRADRRPQGWNLAMGLIRDDLDDEDLAVLERQFPGPG